MVYLQTDSGKAHYPCCPPPLGGGLGGIVIITMEIELSRITLIISGFEYSFLDIILRSSVFNCNEIISEYATKIDFNL